MYDLVMELFEAFGLNRMPETFPELLPWLVAVFIGLSLVIYVFDMIFIVMKAVCGRGRGF